MRAVPYILYLLLIGLFEVFLGDLTTIFGVSVSMTALTIFLVTLYKSESVCLWYGLTAGLVLGAQTPAIMGWFAVTLALLSVLGYSVRQKLNLDSFYSRLLFVLGGCLVHNLVVMLIYSTNIDPIQFLTNVVPSAVYTTVIAWFFLLIKDGVITYQKLKSIF